MKNSYFLYFGFIACLLFACTKDKHKNGAAYASDSIGVYFEQLKKIKGKNGVDNTKALKSLRRAEELIVEKKNSPYSRKMLGELADIYVKGYNSDPGLKKVSQILLDWSIDTKDTTGIAKAYRNLGQYYIENSVNDSSYFYYLKAEKFNSYLRDSLSLGTIYLDIAFIQLYEGDFGGSEISTSKALRCFNRNKDNPKIYEAYNVMGITSNELKNYDKALEYQQKALNFLENHDIPGRDYFRATSLNNIGYVYQKMDKHKDAIKYFESAISNKSLYKSNPAFYAMLLDNIAYSKFKLHDYRELPGLFYKSLKIRDSVKTDKSGSILNKLHLSELYAAQKDTVNAKMFAQQALDFSRKTKVSSDIMASLQQLAKIEHTNAVKYSDEYLKISDSLQQAERKAKDKFARIAFETDEIISQKDKLAEQNRNLLYLFGGILLIGLLLFIIRTQRAKNRELILREAQQKANEDIYNLIISQQDSIEESRVKEKKRIAQELHDGVLGRLFGARLTLDSLNRATDEEAINSRFNYLSELKNIEQDIREISHDLNREKHVLINNFVAIVSNLLEDQRVSHNADVNAVIDDEIKWDDVSNTVKINLYRILQESLQNINKYANAKTINVAFMENGGHITLKVEDDGAGFDSNVKKKGIGIQNMISRVADCNGNIDINSVKSKGTSITVKVPIEKEMSKSV